MLLRKLERYGIRGQAQMIFRSYLSRRKKVVYLDDALSEIKPVTCGVPQGSILGPLLFNLYVNDISNINPTAKSVIYADDTSTFFSGNDISHLSLVHVCNDTTSVLQKWSESNYMRMNDTKTKAVLFRPKNKHLPYSLDIVLNLRQIDIVDHFFPPMCHGSPIYLILQQSWHR